MDIINTFTETPLLVTLQHCWQAFLCLLPMALLAGLTFLLTQND
jgi:hypothetical protein